MGFITMLKINTLYVLNSSMWKAFDQTSCFIFHLFSVVSAPYHLVPLYSETGSSDQAIRLVGTGQPPSAVPMSLSGASGLKIHVKFANLSMEKLFFSANILVTTRLS